MDNEAYQITIVLLWVFYGVQVILVLIDIGLIQEVIKSKRIFFLCLLPYIWVFWLIWSFTKCLKKAWKELPF